MDSFMLDQRMPSGLNMAHFEALRSRINSRLEKIGTKHAHRQIREFPWLYGALGEVPSRVMLISENPSLTGVERADQRTIGGGAATIEDQWCGGAASNCIKRFRPALCQVGLKITPADQSGGWRCYITNVIKEADIVRDFAGRRDKAALAAEWADVLAWEMEQVRPAVVFAMGGTSTALVENLQRRRLIPTEPRPHKIMHYSNRGAGMTDDAVRTAILNDLQVGLAWQPR